ncbi:YHS domain-containing protein [Nisaea acidiphila]|uniref:YHS domain-containing protein n=1 Tax=Nisaea acidiphila TaxID=1862145 RepID=A0A9J7API6_9PROT|nr:YHS domain-containing (seleno)protein [Nisaea acidiphila]UUX49531.1 YHS domain-containing protein [Nisaea acidiphila]
MPQYRVLRSVFIAFLLFTGGVMASAAPSSASEDPVYTGFLSNVAVGGYDPVSYFSATGPVKGLPEFKLDYKGAEWHFANAANRDAFRQHPERYAPQYGGYCAWAVAQGKTAKGDPQNWRIVNGKLYLNYNSDIQTRWEQDIPGFVEAGDRNWPRVLE